MKSLTTSRQIGSKVKCAMIGPTEIELVKLAAVSLSHRGPDAIVVAPSEWSILAHTRLSIVDVAGGAQPFEVTSANGRDTDSAIIRVVANGEIFNHDILRQHSTEYKYKTKSDCEVIAAIALDFFTGKKAVGHCLNLLDGIFAFVATGPGHKFFAARDAIGVNPLFYGIDRTRGIIMLASEAKAFLPFVGLFSFDVREFPAGHFMTDESEAPMRWYLDINKAPASGNPDYMMLRHHVTTAVTKQLMADVPVGVLLSGGLDSSLVAAIAAKHLAKFGRGESCILHTFAVGLAESPDIIAARSVAAFIKSTHHEVIISTDTVIAKIPDAVWFVETFDVATIRSSIPMMLVAARARDLGFRVVLCGDGSDEIFAGYAYNVYAPGGDQLHLECIRKVMSLGHYDCKRANHSTMSAGVECRCPLLDRTLVNYVMNGFDPQHKMTTDAGKTKMVLRNAFAGQNLLPVDILMRGKVQFSAGCGDGLINALIEHGNRTITDEQWNDRAVKFPNKTPLTREAYLYRDEFERKFSRSFVQIVSYEPSLNCSTIEAMSWFPEDIKANMDPCGRRFHS